MIQSVHDSAEQNLDGLEVDDHVVLVQLSGRNYDVNLARVPMRKSAGFRVLVQHVPGFDREGAADAIHA